MFLCVAGDRAWHSGPSSADPGLSGVSLGEFFWRGAEKEERNISPELLALLLARSAFLEAGFPALLLRSSSVESPRGPFVELGKERRKEEEGFRDVFSPRQEEARFARALELGKELGKYGYSLVIGASVPRNAPGNALFLRLLGWGEELALDDPGLEAERNTFREQAEGETGIGYGGLGGDPWEALSWGGDPSVAAVAGIVAGVPRSCEVILAGGLDMFAAAALLRNRKIRRPLVISSLSGEAEAVLAPRRALARELGAVLREHSFERIKELSRGESFSCFSDRCNVAGVSGCLEYAMELGVSGESVFRRAREELGAARRAGFLK